MKKVIILFFYVVICHMSMAQHSNNLSKEDAWNIVKEKILLDKTEGTEVSVSDSIIRAGSTISTYVDNEKSPAYDSWFFFIDDIPNANWSHTCRYVYVNIRNGEYKISKKSFPPLLDNMTQITRNTENREISGLQIMGDITSSGTRTSSNTSLSLTNHEYAIIINGGISASMNNVRYWNDCSAMYKTLINVYGYSKDHIYVLMSDGTNPGADLKLINGNYISSPLDLDGDGLSDIQYAATRSNIASVFSTLSNVLTSGDNLFIFTMDHGYQVSGNHVALCLWNSEMLYDYEFASYINALNVNKVSICMGQCNSGGFIDNITKDNVVISTACQYDESSYAMSNLLYDEYVYHWISAVAGMTPDGTPVNADSNNDGKISMSEAFFYSESNDTQNEHPQYVSTSLGVGYYLTLHTEISIVGSKDICGINAYSVENMPSDCDVYWHFSGSSSLNGLIYPSSYYNYMCAINNSNNQYINETLVATISLNNVVWGDCSMKVSTAGDFSATLQNTGGTIGGITYPTFTSPFADDAHQGVFELCQVTLSSQDFVDCVFTVSGFTPTQWNVVGSNIYVQFPSAGNSTKICDVIGRQTTGCKIFHFQLIILPGSLLSNSLLDNFSINMSDRHCIVTFNETSSAIDCEGTTVKYLIPVPTRWKIYVVDSTTGDIKVQENNVGNTASFNTSGWKSGVYIVTCEIGDQKVSKKIIVK